MDKRRSGLCARLLAAALACAAASVPASGSGTFRVGLRILSACEVEVPASRMAADVRCSSPSSHIETVTREAATPVARSLLHVRDGASELLTVVTVTF